jgi:hypothetical protein
MTNTMSLALLLGLGALSVTSCSSSSSPPSTLPPHFDPAYAPATVANPQPAEPEQAFDDKLAERGEAVAQPVPAEVARKLEADYQASLNRTDEANGLINSATHEHAPVDFPALFEKIRSTMPPARAALLMQYASAANEVPDAAARLALLQRLSSQELNNVR